MPSFSAQLKEAFVAAPASLPSSAGLEQDVQRRMFVVMASFVMLLTAGYCAMYGLQRQWTLLAMNALLLVGTALATALACRAQRFAWPLRIMAGLVFGELALVTLGQGAGLPSAGWWLSVIPFILAGSGMFFLAIAAVVGFVTIVGLLYMGFDAGLFGLANEATVEPWRRFVAVVGSELLTLCLIIVAMRSRSQMAQAIETARAAAQEAAEIKARFLANMSHEIRTPLTGIIGAAEVMASPGLSDAQRMQLVGLQRQSARTLLALLNDVLDFAKLDAGRVQLEHQPVFLRGVVMEANELFSMQAFGKGIELSSSCDPDVPQSFHGDPVRLRQIVNNLVGNAVKFTSQGGVHIHLSVDADARPQPPATHWVRVEVADSGPGIADDQLRRLFNPFMQADNSATRRFGGTGLGLSIARELAQLMGGRIEVASRPGRGSRFALVVPLVAESREPPAAQPAPRPDVVVASASPGLLRHVASLLHELRVAPSTLADLPDEPALRGCRLLLIDALLLQALPRPADWLAAQAAAGRRVALLTPLGSDAVVGLPQDAQLLFKPVRRRALEAVLSQTGGAPTDGASSPPASQPLTGLRVLVAEDNPVNQVIVQAMLAELGAAATMVGDGREALARALAEPRFDVVLMDVHMPELDGLAATRMLREREAERGLPRITVLAMTAMAEHEEGAACLAAGMDGYLAKPFGLAQLRRGLERHLAAGTLEANA